MNQLQKLLLSMLITISSRLLADAPNSVIGQVTDANPPTFASPNYIIISPTQPLAYVPNQASTTVSIVNTTNNTITGLVTDLDPATFAGPLNGTFSPDGSLAYITNQNNNKVSIINTATNSVTGIVSDPDSTFKNPQAMVFIPNSSPLTAYVANYGGSNNGSVSIVQNNAVIGTVSGISGAQLPSIAVTPDGSKALVVDTAGQRIFVINTSTNAVTQSISGITNPQCIAISPDGTKAYVGTAGAPVAIIDIASNTVTGAITDLNPPSIYDVNSIVFSPDGKTAYIISYEGETQGAICIVNVATDTVTGLVTDLNPPLIYYPWGAAITPNGNALYAVQPYGEDAAGDPFVIVVNTATSDPILPPATIAARKTANIFLTQTDIINVITWTAPSSGTTPANYNIYRDAALTQLIATIPATSPLIYLDHNRQPSVMYSYYIVSIDASGNVSSPISTTIVG